MEYFTQIILFKGGIFIILKILNNNVVISENDMGEEIILMGRGLAFGKKIGDPIDEELVEKEFILKDSFSSNQLEQLFESMPIKEVGIIKQIVDKAEEQLHQEFSSAFFLQLADHIHYAIKRVQEGIEIPNPLLFDIRKFYPKEFSIASEAVIQIQDELDVLLPETEIGFITMHIVNNEQVNSDLTMQTTILETEIIRDILNIISRFFGIVFNCDDLNYQRLVTHLQYFIQKYLKNELSDEKDIFLFTLIQSKYRKSFQVVKRINDYMSYTYGKSLGESEMIYLTIHIQRLVDEVK